jgi:hypothetical protein
VFLAPDPDFVPDLGSRFELARSIEERRGSKRAITEKERESCSPASARVREGKRAERGGTRPGETGEARIKTARTDPDDDRNAPLNE